MTQYIDKTAVVDKIKKLISSGKIKCQQSQENGDQVSYIAWSEHIATCGKILSFLDTLEVKEVDLREEMDKEWNKCEPIDEGMGLEIASIEHEQFDNIAKYFFELGLNTKKSFGQMK